MAAFPPRKKTIGQTVGRTGPLTQLSQPGSGHPQMTGTPVVLGADAKRDAVMGAKKMKRS
jgi:hypothetical protein